MNIYIISNYYNIDTNIFKIIKSDDMVVFMNHSFHDGKLFDNKKKILFIRRNNNNSYSGYKDNYNNRYIEIYFVNGYLDDKELINNIDNCPKTLFKNNITNYPTNKVPTTGFICYFYMKDKFPDANICLIGFTGGSSYKNNLIGKIHDYNYEQEYYYKNNVKIINKEKINVNLLNEKNNDIDKLLLIKSRIRI